MNLVGSSFYKATWCALCPDCDGVCIGSKFRAFQNIFWVSWKLKKKKVEMVCRARLCTCFIIVIRTGFRALSRFLIGLEFQASSAVDLQSNMVCPDLGGERERDWEMAQTFRKTFRTLQTIQATHATVPVAVKVFFVEILINSRASLVATWRCCNGKVLGTGSRLIRERIVQIAQSLWTFPTVSAHYLAPQRRKCLKTPDERCPCQARRLGSEGWG